MPPSRLGLLQIDTSEKKHQLFMTEHYLLHRAVRIGPPKTALVQFLRAYPQPAAVIDDQLQAVAPCIRENENVAALRSATQMIAHQTVEPIEVLAHIGRAGCDIDTCRRSKPKHRLRSFQYGQQALQGSRIEPATHFNSTPAAQLDYQNTLAPRISVGILSAGPNDFHRKHRPAT